MLWPVLIILTVAALAGILWPLLRARKPAAIAGHDAAFYREQMNAIDRDVEAGLVCADDAQRTRLEAGRRALAASVASAAAPTSSRLASRIAAVLMLLAVPSVALGLYWRIGSPNLPDAPLDDRLAASKANPGIDTIVARLEAHIAAHPEDGRAQELIAPVYLRMDRPGDAARAYAEALKLLGETPVRLAAYAEALVAAAGGEIDADAVASFEKAVAADPLQAKARFYLGAAAEQAGDKAKALSIWGKMIEEGPPDAPWLATVRARVAATSGAVAPSQVESVAALPANERNAMIRSMVEGLAARLAQNGNDAEGWLRLMRSLSVLKEQERAKTALADARRALAADPAALQRVDAMARELGLGG